MKAVRFDQTGKKLGEMQLPKEFFGVKVNLPLVAQAVRVYLANQRQGGAKVKGRSEVKRTKAKWYRQKGTGRARHGARSAPIFVGGGVAHGPTGEENYSLKLPRQMRKKALVAALSAKAGDGEVKIVEGLSKVSGKTKEMEKLVFGVGGEGKRVTLVLEGKMEKVVRGARNLSKVGTVLVKELNAYTVSRGGVLLFAKEAIESLGKEKRKKEEEKKEVEKKGEKESK